MQTNELKNKIFVKYYMLTFIGCCILYLLLFLFESSLIIPYTLIVFGLYNIIGIYMTEKLLLTPISIFSLIWLLIIPICSFEYPLMDSLSIFEWSKVLLFIISFSLGAILTSHIKGHSCKKIKQLKPATRKINYLVLILSIFSLVMLYINYGGIPLFASDANVAKDLFRSIPIWSFISYFGSIASITLIIDNEKVLHKKSFIILIVIYMLLLIFSAERFFVTLLVLLIIFIYSKQKINNQLSKKLIGGVGIILLIFVFVLNYRGNAEQKQLYFINSGIYRGDAQSLVNTEIIRYFGMQERLLTTTFEDIQPGYTKGTLTLSPVLKLIGVTPIEAPKIQIYGYTSKSIITKLYFDFGHLWCLAVIILSFMINSQFKNYSRKNNITSQYMYLASMVLLLFSFYAYIDNFIILFLHFPIYVIFIQTINIVKR